jgi:hypothetical protein
MSELKGDVKIITDLINSRINDVIGRNIEFEKRAEKKLDDTRLIVKDEISIVHKRLDKLEENKETTIIMQGQIIQLQKDVNENKTSIKTLFGKIPKQAVSNFMTKIIWGGIGAICMLIISLVISKLVGLI